MSVSDENIWEVSECPDWRDDPKKMSAHLLSDAYILPMSLLCHAGSSTGNECNNSQHDHL